MPNHVINRLTFDCPEDRLKLILFLTERTSTQYHST